MGCIRKETKSRTQKPQHPSHNLKKHEVEVCREKEIPEAGASLRSSIDRRVNTSMKFEDRSPEETARQERCARGDAWALAKNIKKLKKEDRATFHSPSGEWILPAASTINSEERKFVVHTGARLWM